MEYLDPIFLIKSLGLLGIFFIIFAESGLFFGFFLPGDSLLFTAGFLASQDYLSLIPLLIFSFIAAVLGDNVGYAFGRRYGEKIWSKEDSLFFHKKYIDKTQAFYNKHGKKTIILCRFTPIIRTFAPIMAGVGKMNYKTFFLYNIVGGFIWTFGLILLGYFLGQAIPSVDKYLLPIIGAIIIVSLLPTFWEIWKSWREKSSTV